MKFFTDFFIPSLEPLTSGVLTQPVQSIVFEALVWAVLYVIFSQLANKYLRDVYRQFHFWKLAKERSGIFMKNGQDDTVLFTLITCHHGTAGTMMMYGYLTGDPIWFRHGYLCETGFEIADILSMIIKFYPYRPLDGLKDEMLPAMIFHHTPGTVLALPIFLLGLYENEHLQAITIALLAGGAIASIFAQILYTMPTVTQRDIISFTGMYALSLAFFFYCRWYIFPLHSHLLLQDMYETNLGSNPYVMNGLLAAGVVFSLFNFVITIDVIPKMVRYIRRCFDGVTPMEDGKVPSTRDSLVVQSYAAGTYNGRRSSVMKIVSSRNRSSMMGMVGMVSLEDLGLVEEELDSDDDSSAISDENKPTKDEVTKKVE